MSRKKRRWVMRIGNCVVIPLICLMAAFIAFAANMDEDLIQAAKNNDIKTVNDLIGKGADVNAANAFLATPLIVAAKSGNTECVKTLLKAGANINAK